MNKIILSTVLGATLFLVGCGSSPEVQTTNKTMGQELLDLKSSYDQGIISEREYNNAKEDILDRYDQ